MCVSDIHITQSTLAEDHYQPPKRRTYFKIGSFLRCCLGYYSQIVTEKVSLLVPEDGSIPWSAVEIRN